MRINGFRCDGCGKEHLLDLTRAQDAYDVYRSIPTDWYLVSLGMFGNREPWIFCSRECLYEHSLAWQDKEPA